MPDLSDILPAAVSGLALVALLMALLWVVHLVIGNAAVVDVGWSVSVLLLAAWYAWLFEGGARAWLLAGLAAVWGGRLAWHLLTARVIGRQEDGRYAELRRRWQARLAAKFFVFFQAQALLALVLSVPFFVTARHGGAPDVLQWGAALLWLVAMTGEVTADHQLERFKRDPANRGLVCDTGLWRYSRHPNYFFEWLIWIAYALYATTSPDGWLAWIAPSLMLFLLFRVTGIPETEAQAVRSRGDAYRRYQQTTSVFVPWFRGRV